MPPSRARRWQIALATALLALVLAVTVAGHIRRSLWSDEAWEVRYALQPSLVETWACAVMMGRPASSGFLAVQHLLAGTGAHNQWVWRLPAALLAGVALAGMVVLAQALAGDVRWGLVVALMLCAAPQFQRYATEVKQYSGDAAATLVLIFIAQRWVRSRRRRWSWAWLGGSLLFLWLGFFALFVLAAVSAVLTAWWLAHRQWEPAARTVILGAAVAVVFLVIHRMYDLPLARALAATSYWNDQYLPSGAGLLRGVWDWWGRLFDAAWNLYHVPSALLTLLALAGLFAWLRAQPFTALCTLALVLTVAAASARGLWPAHARTNLAIIVILHLWLAAGPLLLIRWGAARLAPRAPARLRLVASWSATAAALALALLGLRGALEADFEPARINQLMAQIAAHARPGQRVLLEESVELNLRLRTTALPCDCRLAPWPAPRTIVNDYLPLLDRRPDHATLMAFGYVNPDVQQTLDHLRARLSTMGTVDLLWSDRRVCLWLFTPRARPGP